MPTYQYACTECGHAFEQVQSFSEDSLTVCPQCQGRLRKVYNAVGVVFKGSGFYRTDSRSPESSGSSESGKESAKESGKDSGAKESGSGAKDSGSGSGSAGGSKDAGAKPAPAKTDAKPTGGTTKAASGS